MSRRAESRLVIIAGHFNSQDAQVRSLNSQACAAHNTLFYARPEAHKDCRYAKPTSQGPSLAELEAMGHASKTISQLSTPQHQRIPSQRIYDADIQQQQQCLSTTTPPLFARVESPTSISSKNTQQPVIATVPTPSSKPDSMFNKYSAESKLIETDFGYILEVPLPGVSSEDVKVELLPGGRLMVSAHSKRTTDSHIYNSNSNNTSGGLSSYPALYSQIPELFGLPKGFPGKSSQNGKFMLSWDLPEDANIDSIRAEFKDGLLRVQVSKKHVLSLF